MRPLAIVALLAPAPALAAWPEDLVISDMLDHAGSPIAGEAARAAFDDMVADLGTAIANKPVAPARTLGSAGFDLSMGSTFSLVRSGIRADGTPSGWSLAQPGLQGTSMLILPTLTARKGLPSSFEVGGSAAWVGMSRQGVLSGFARVAPIEGYEPWPDVSFQVGYAGYIGNPELDLGVIDMTATLGGTFAFGSYPGIRQAQVSPYIGGGLLLVYAKVNVPEDVEAAMFTAEGDEDPRLVSLAPLPQVQGGLQVTNSTVLVRLAGTWSPGGAPSIHAGMGFMF